jgi:hypothetical protein
MVMTNKYLLFALIFFTGFTTNDIRREIIAIEWYLSSEPENILGYTFENAGYNGYDEQLLPLFSKIYDLENPEQDFQIVLENPVFEEVKIGNKDFHISGLPQEVSVNKFRLQSGNIHKIEIQVPAVIQRNNKVLLLKRFELKLIPVNLKSAKIQEYTWKQESVLREGRWIKISTSAKGIYKIPYATLSGWGFSNPAQVKVFGAGGMILSENPGDIEYDDLPQLSIIHGKNNGTDCIFFYAPGAIDWKPNEPNNFLEHRINHYANGGFIFLTEQSGTNKVVDAYPTADGNPTHSISSFDEYALVESEQINLLHSGKQWFGDKFTHGSSRNYTFDLTSAEENTSLSLRINAVARSSASSQINVVAGQTNIGKIEFAGVNTSSSTTTYANERAALFTAPASSGNLNVGLQYAASGANPEAWLDYIELNYRRKLAAGNEAMFFRDLNSAGINNILEFSVQNATTDLKVWDVSNPFDVKEVPLEVSGNVAKGKRPASKLNEYVAFKLNGNFPEPEHIGEVKNQNLHALSTPEYLIISHPNFLNQARELADYHKAIDGMTVEVVSANDVYNEFSSGNKDAAGLRNFIKMFYDRNEGLKYVLLFGDGSYDNKGNKPGTINLIPTFQSETSLSPVNSFVTDDYFVLLDAGESILSGAVDLGLGRIPASTPFEAELAVRKIKNYQAQEALGDWRNVLCFIGDDQDNSLHMRDSEELANQVNATHGEFITDKIYFDAYRQITGPGGESYPEVTKAINNRVKEGVLILNYVGHANDRFLADEKVLDISHINSWANTTRLPIFVTATCEFTRFDSDDKSAGEYVFFNPNGGGIGLFSTTRLVYANSNFLMSKSFYRFVFAKDTNGEQYRMGDIMRLAKINTSNANVVNKRNFTLIADPALKLSYPRHKVITSSINGNEPSEVPDTIGALQKITITGYVADEFENKLSNFSGKIVPTVYDKAAMKKTRGNGGEPTMEFKVQENIIYKGLAEVVNGEFSFSFVIPKDISYNPGNGKIVYYADNGETDAHGVFNNFIISGSGSGIADNQGPEIELYLDSPEFTSGEKVSKNPTLLAFLSDENGINMVGSGIGHDITAVLNDDYGNTMILNNYYQANAGDYSSGTVRYPLRDLPVGKHTLRLKVWDVANNSSEAEIEFEVTGDFYIENALNYPNPMNNYTFFTFEHNQADATFEAIYEIFDQTGIRVDYFVTQVGSNGRVSNPVRWDLFESQVQLRSGVYPYRITVQNSDGAIASATGKLIFAH